MTFGKLARSREGLSAKGVTVLAAGGLLAIAAATSTWAQAPTALDRLRASDATGKPKEIELDRSKLKIVEAAPLSPGAERPAIKTASTTATRPAAPRPPEPASLRTEVNQRLRDLELCRGSTRSGQIQLRWTILPDGRTTNTLVLEQQPTDMDVMKCARKRMETWRFTPATAGSIDMESTYSFARPEPAREAVASEGDEAKKAPEGKVNEGKLNEAKFNDAKLPDGKLNEAKQPDGKLNEARFNEAKTTETKPPLETKAAEPKDPEGKVPEAKVPEGRMHEDDGAEK